jgi:succinate dehydrogenase flavin-adding protein (antitoxin of CptAB toxin-antitoxin module)
MVNSRLDNALDYMNKYNIKVSSNEAFKKYIDFLNKNDDNIQKTINDIEKYKDVTSCVLFQSLNQEPDANTNKTPDTKNIIVNKVSII